MAFPPQGEPSVFLYHCILPVDEDLTAFSTVPPMTLLLVYAVLTVYFV